jgi:MFS family permease
MAFHTTYAIVPLFLKQLGAPTGVVVSVAGLFAILMALPQLFSALMGRNIRNIKSVAIGVHVLVWPPVFMMGFVFAFFVPTGPTAWIYYYTCFILYGISLGFLIPIWADFLRHAVNDDSRGTFLGVSFAFNSIGGFLGGIIVKILFSSSIAFPKNFGYGFFIYLLMIMIATVLYLGLRIKSPAEKRPHKSVAEFLAETKRIIKTHISFRRYLIARAFLTVIFPAISMYAVFMQEKFGFDISTAGIFTILNVVAYGLSSYLSGKIGDRFGHKTAIVFSFTAHLFAVLTALFTTTMFGVYTVFIFLGFGYGSFMPASMNMVYSFAGKNDSKLYMALIDTFLAPFILITIFAAAYISETFGTMQLFWVIAGMLCLGLSIMIFYVKDPSLTEREAERILV